MRRKVVTKCGGNVERPRRGGQQAPAVMRWKVTCRGHSANCSGKIGGEILREEAKPFAHVAGGTLIAGVAEVIDQL